MQCKKCGAPLGETDKFCGKCGTPVEATPAAEVATPAETAQATPAQTPETTTQPAAQAAPAEPERVVLQPTPEQPVQPAVQQAAASMDAQNNAPQSFGSGSNKIVEWLSLILAIGSVVFLFIYVYVGIALGVAAVVASIKIKNKHSKKAKIIGIVGAVLCALYAIGSSDYLGLLNINTSDKEISGSWFCLEPMNLMEIRSDNTGSIWSEATFGNGQYTLKTGGRIEDGQFTSGLTRSGTYTVKPSTINEDAWESVKGTLSRVWDLTDDLPKSIMLSTDTGAITALKIYTKSGEILMLYTGGDSYVCWQKGSSSDPTNQS